MKLILLDIVTTFKNNPNCFFNCIKNREIGSGIGLLTGSDGELVTENLSVATLLNIYFSSVFNIAISNTSTDIINDENLYTITDPVHTPPDFQITTQEVLKAPQSLKTNKS